MAKVTFNVNAPMRQNHKYIDRYYKNGRWHYIYTTQDMYRRRGYKRTNHGNKYDEQYLRDTNKIFSSTKKYTFNGDQKVTLRDRGKLERATDSAKRNLYYKTAPLQGQVRQTKKAADKVINKLSGQASKSLGSMRKSINRGMKKVDSFLAKHVEVSAKITYTDKSGKTRTRYSNGKPVRFK